MHTKYTHTHIIRKNPAEKIRGVADGSSFSSVFESAGAEPVCTRRRAAAIHSPAHSAAVSASPAAPANMIFIRIKNLRQDKSYSEISPVSDTII